ncbi:MAG TPA: NUDIX domain-containing protein [Candidatus Saccharimonadales bacterium]|nr:NUDIX domain-containing protein [Candidatus Saccharimonadales bacterium]
MLAVTGGLSAKEETQLLNLLSKVCQPFSASFFEALTDLLPVIPFEAVILREHMGRRQICLVWRGHEDGNAEKWPDCWTIPGTVLRVTDESLNAAMVRLANKELGVQAFASWRTVGMRLLHGKHEHGRAQTLQMVNLATLSDGQSTKGEWFYLDELPPEFLVAQQSLIDFALANE